MWKGRQDFVRIKEAIASRQGWDYVVLTVDPKAEDGKGSAYRALWRKWQSLRQWIKRTYGAKVEYICLVEQHQSGWPHVNILVHCPPLHAAATATPMAWKEVRRGLNEAAVRAGWGVRLWFEPVRNLDAIAAYQLKLVSEAAKLSQAPVNAPRNFRRLRGSRGLLPSRKTNPDVTGGILQVQVDDAQRNLEKIVAVAKWIAEPVREEGEALETLSAVVPNCRLSDQVADGCAPVVLNAEAMSEREVEAALESAEPGPVIVISVRGGGRERPKEGARLEEEAGGLRGPP